MNRIAKWTVGSLATTVVAAIVLTAAAAITAVNAPARGGQSGDSALPDVCVQKPRQKVEIATAKLIIEFNSTDGDLGVHGAFDDQGWSELCVFDPSGRPIAVFDPRNQLNDLTMAGVFFESREPPIADFSMEELAAAFPEGEYTVRGKSFDGRVLIGTALFTHDVPAPPDHRRARAGRGSRASGDPGARERPGDRVGAGDRGADRRSRSPSRDTR